MGTLHEDLRTLIIASRLIPLTLRNISLKGLGKIKMHILV